MEDWMERVGKISKVTINGLFTSGLQAYTTSSEMAGGGYFV